MADEAAKKHVIILGAGASITSGYPDANHLRLLLSSQQVLRQKLSLHGNFTAEFLDKVLAEMMGGHMERPIGLFRHGAFATVDEFSYLARGQFRSDVQRLKELLRFALALHDPELSFHESDYYRFIQKLF